jgi:hypothetical protein
MLQHIGKIDEFQWIIISLPSLNFTLFQTVRKDRICPACVLDLVGRRSPTRYASAPDLVQPYH